MEGEKRRERLLELLKDAEQPLSGGALAGLLGVSRQVIVQDVALLRATNKNILATTRGYVLYHQKKERHHRCFYVNHTDAQIRDELNTIIDNGGKVLDIIVSHEVYGQISVDLVLESRSDVDELCRKLLSSQAKPLKALAGGAHMHTVEASSEVILDNIQRALNEKGYLGEGYENN